MPVNSANQGIPEQQGADPANLPSAQVSWDGVMENRLVQRYASIADRTARRPAPNENELSTLADVDRVEVYDSANWVSALHRSVWTEVEVLADQVLAASSTALQNVTALVAALPTAGTFWFEAELFYDCTAVADIGVAFTWPAGVTNPRWGAIGGATTVAGRVGDGHFPVVNVSGTQVNFGGSGSGTANTMALTIKGRLTMGGTAGNLQLQAAQATSEASTITVRIGSRLRVWRVS